MNKYSNKIVEKDEHMKRKRVFIYLIVLSILLCSLYFYFKKKKRLYLIEFPKVEINSQFDYKKYIKEVKNGKISEVTCQTSQLNMSRLGKYTIVYSYHGKDYPLTVEVVDTTKPEIKELVKLKVLINTEIDFYQGIEISDNSGLYPQVTIDSSKLDTSRDGEYIVQYKTKDLSGNVNVFERKIEVMKEIGTSEQSSQKIVYLTFDDGPSSNTKKILDILDKYEAKATFFVTGTHQKYNYLIKEAHQKGHTIGLHSYCHEYNIIYSSTAAYFRDLTQLENMVEKLIGYKPRYIRFPGGSSNKVSLKYNRGIMTVLARKVVEKGYQYYDWNGETGDATGNHVSVDKLIKNATVKNDNNIVMLAHDTDAKDTTVEALPSIIQYYQNKGYVFKAIDEQSFYAHQSINN